MPAAIISEVAHQKADLHVTAEPDDKTARPTQGAAIHRKFTDLFTDYTGVTTKTLDAAHAHLQDDANRGSDALYRAVRDTGRWLWRDQMHGALERNFPRFEAKFYLDQFRNPEEESYDGEGEEVLKTLNDGKAPEESEIESGIRDDFVPKAITYAMKVLGDKGWDL